MSCRALWVSRGKTSQYSSQYFVYLYYIYVNNFRRALLLLRKKRFIEEQLKKTDGTLENIEKMIQDLEFAQIEMKVCNYTSIPVLWFKCKKIKIYYYIIFN